MRRALFTMTVALSGAAGAQDSARVSAVLLQVDSLRLESCRGGKLSADGLTCTGAKYPPRMAVLRRLANRVDSLTLGFLAPVVAVCTPPYCNPSSPGNVGYAMTVYYNSLGFGLPAPGKDTVTVCAVAESQTGERRLAWPPVLVRTMGDSAQFVARDREPLSRTCARAIRSAGLVSTDSLPVQWDGDWMTLGARRLWRPFPVVVP